jgi:hypothetical protein
MRVSGDTAELSQRTTEHVRTLADLVRVCRIDLQEWAVERWVCNKWDGATGEACYQVKATLRLRRPVVEAARLAKDLLADAAKGMPAWPVRRSAAPRGEFALELAIPDLHLGKLAWSKETGGEDYDSAIAARVYQQAVEALLTRTKGFTFGRILLPIGNDFLNADNKAGTTTKGTPLDNDSRYHRTFVRGRQLLTQTVDRLRRLAPVTVITVPGNHDVLAAFHLGDALACWYHRTKDVTVLNDAIPRKYVRWGQVLLMFTHGDKGKKTDYPLLMATERPEDFGATKYREIHTGHLHMTRVDERHGVRTRISPALCPPDAWHSDNHYVGQQRSAEAYVWSRREGLVSMAVYTV